MYYCSLKRLGIERPFKEIFWRFLDISKKTKQKKSNKFLHAPVEICVALLCCSFATLMVYKIPMEDVKSLAKAFSQLESGECAENGV